MRKLSRRWKRIVALLACVAALGALAGGAYLLRQSQLDARARAARDAGRAALASGDHQGALDGLGRYLRRFGDREATAEDYVLYARARLGVPLANGAHRRDAISMLLRARRLDPARSDARSDLLELYISTGYALEALELLDGIAAEQPDDAATIRRRRDILEALRRMPEALADAKRVNAIAPQSVADAIATLRLLLACDTAPSEVDSWVETTIAGRSGDVGFEILRSVVFLARNDPASARTILDRVVAGCGPSNDPALVGHLVTQLDATGRYAESLDVLQRMDASASPAMLTELARRLWYAGRTADLTSAPSVFDGDAARAVPEILAIRGAALRAVGRTAEADAIREALAASPDDTGRMWAALLVAAGPDPRSRTAALTTLRAAAAARPDSALLRCRLGDELATIGESQLALQAWIAAAERAPMWPAPTRAVVDALLGAGREGLAATIAQVAVTRFPRDAGTLSTFVRAAAAASPHLDRAQADTLLAAVGAILRESPDHADELLPVQVDLLLRSGDGAAAEARLLDVLAAEAPLREATLLRLAGLASRSGVPLCGAILDVSEKVHGLSPALALTRALDRSQGAGREAGARLLEAERARSGAARPDLRWDMAEATYQGASASPTAGAAWLACADAHPDALPAQLGALGSRAAWSDRDAVSRVIDRVAALTGDAATTWRIARARWDLTAPSPTQATIAEAASSLRRVIDAAPQDSAARILFAQALERLGNLQAAERELRMAAQLAPKGTSIGLEIARLAQAQGHVDAAREELERVLAGPDLAPPQIERAAYLLALSHDVGRCAELLAPMASREKASRAGLLLLARAYAALGEDERAIELCERLEGDLVPETIEAVADLYAAAGRATDAESVLARLGDAERQAGDLELVRARHAARWSPAGAATEWFRRAVDAAPSRAETWTSGGRPALGLGAAPKVAARHAAPPAAEVEPVRCLRAMRPLCSAALRDPRLRLVLLDGVESGAARPALVAALSATTEGWPDEQRRSGTAGTVRRLAQQNPGELSLQILAADLSASVGELNEACAISQRAMSLFPASVHAAWQAADLLGRGGRWAAALEAGLAWRQRGSRRDTRPDLFLARAMLHLGRAEDAAAALQPHVADALGTSDGHDSLLLVYAAAQARAGRAETAANVLRELARRPERAGRLPVSMDLALLGDAAGATAWLDACAVHLPAGDAGAQVALARAWGAAWERFREPSLLAKAQCILAEVASAPGAPAGARFVSANLAHRSGDLATAAREYARALQEEPANTDARNNLAVVLAESGKWQEAVDEATAAVTAAPRNAAYRDTLAFSLRKGREFDRAIASLRAAIELEPTNPEWHVSLAETLAESGERLQAEREAALVDGLIARGAALAGDLRKRLDSVRASLR